MHEPLLINNIKKKDFMSGNEAFKLDADCYILNLQFWCN